METLSLLLRLLACADLHRECFTENGGRRPRVPHFPPGFHHSSSRLLAQALHVKNLSFAAYLPALLVPLVLHFEYRVSRPFLLPLYMNDVEQMFCKLRLDGVLGSSSPRKV